MPICIKCSSETHEQEDCPTWGPAAALRAAGVDITAGQLREMHERALAEFPAALPAQGGQKPAGNHVTLDSVRAAYATLAARPRPPKCIAVAPDVMDRLRSTAWPDPPPGVLNPLLGIPLVVDEDLPPGTVEPRDEFPRPPAVNS